MTEPPASLLPRLLPRRARVALRRWIPATRNDWIFAWRTAITSFVAFYIARLAGLEEPQWSMMTVFIVAQPLTGMVVSKGVFRVIGTLCGASVGVLLAHFLGATPTLFVVALAFWMGLCTALSSLLRNFAAYGMVLAGYTVPIAALPAFGRPELIDIAEARCLEIVLGIVCAVLASRFVFPRPVRPVLVQRLGRCLVDLAQYGAGALAPDAAAPERRRRRAMAQRQLIAEIQALDQLRSYFIAESPGRSGDNRRIRHLLGDVLLALSAMVTVETHLGPEHRGLRDTLAEVAAALARLADTLGESDRPAALLQRLDAVAATISACQAAADGRGVEGLGEAAALSVLADLVEGVSHALAAYAALRSKEATHLRSTRRPAVFASYHDYEAAFRHFVRSFAATGMVALFWRLTDWPGTDAVVALVASIVGLFATMPNPLQVAFTFARGVLLALPAAFLAGQLVLPALPAAPGAAWLVPVLGPPLVGAALMMTQPATVGTATAFAIFTIALSNPGGPFLWEPTLFFYVMAALLAGLALCILVFRLVLPPNPRRAIARLTAAMRADVARLCTDETVPGRPVFENRMYDRVNRMLTRLSAVDETDAGTGAYRGVIAAATPGRTVGPSEGDRLLAGSLATLSMGLEVLRLRRGSARGALSAAGHEEVRGFLRRLAAMLVQGTEEAVIQDLVLEARRIAGMLSAAPTGQGYPLRLAATLRLIATALADHAAFFAATPLLGFSAPRPVGWMSAALPVNRHRSDG